MSEFSTNFKSAELCKTCGNTVWIKGNSTFCKLGCRGIIFRRRILLECNGCSKIFSNLPYLKRRTNYCSMECYWISTNRKEKRKCLACGKEFWADGFLIKKGFGLFCDRECQHKAYPERIIKHCLECGKEISIQPSKLKLVKFCSKECMDDNMRDYVDRICDGCKKRFLIPRSTVNRGGGHFCNFRCYKHYAGETSIEKKVRIVLEKYQLKFKQEAKIGTRFWVDFLLEEKNLVIECDGEYWHSLPIAKDRDRRKNILLKKIGYRILRLPESLINKSSENELSNLIIANI